MALSDIPKFQAAVSEDAGLQEQLQAIMAKVTEGVGMPLSASSDVDWSPLLAFAKTLGLDFTADEIKEAIFGGGRELSEDELDAAVGGGLFNLSAFNFGGTTPLPGVSGVSGDDTIHGFAKGPVEIDTLDGGKTAFGLGDDTIHGKR